MFKPQNFFACTNNNIINFASEVGTCDQTYSNANILVAVDFTLSESSVKLF